MGSTPPFKKKVSPPRPLEHFDPSGCQFGPPGGCPQTETATWPSRSCRSSPDHLDHSDHHLIIWMDKEGNRLTRRPSSELLLGNDNSMTGCRKPVKTVVAIVLEMLDRRTLLCNRPSTREVLKEVADIDQNCPWDRVRWEPATSHRFCFKAPKIVLGEYVFL